MRESDARNIQQKVDDNEYMQKNLKMQEQMLKNHLLELNKQQMEEYQQKIKIMVRSGYINTNRNN